MHKGWKFANIKNPVKTYGNDLTRTINSHEADPSSSHEFGFFFKKTFAEKCGYLVAITCTYII